MPQEPHSPCPRLKLSHAILNGSLPSTKGHRRSPLATHSLSPFHHPRWPANILGEIQLAATSWEAIPYLRAWETDPRHSRLHSYIWIPHSVALSWVSKLVLVGGRESFGPSRPLEWLGQIWLQLEPSSYKQPRGHEECYHFLCVFLSEKRWAANIIVCWLIHSFTQLLCSSLSNVGQARGNYSARVCWWNGGFHGTRYTCSESLRIGIGELDRCRGKRSITREEAHINTHTHTQKAVHTGYSWHLGRSGWTEALGKIWQVMEESAGESQPRAWVRGKRGRFLNWNAMLQSKYSRVENQTIDTSKRIAVVFLPEFKKMNLRIIKQVFSELLLLGPSVYSSRGT